MDTLKAPLNELDEGKLRPLTIRTKLPDGTTEAISKARLDLLNLLGKMLGEDTYGGLVQVEAPDLESALRRFDVEQHLVARWEGERIGEFLENLADDEAGVALRDSFAAYVAAREPVLPLMRTLAVEPLAVAAHAPTRALLLAFIAAYEALNATLRDKFEALYQRFGQDANEVLGHLLLLETIVLQIDGRTYAIAAPTHPLFLWHYARYAEIVDAQRDRLDERDRELIAQAAEHLPFFLTSILIPSSAIGTETILYFLSRLGPLPYFGREAEGGASDDGLASVRALVEAQLALEPHSQRGYRLGLDRPAGCWRLPQHARRPRRRGEAQRRPPDHLPPSPAHGRGGTAPRRGRGGPDRPGLPRDHPTPAVHLRGARPAAAGTRATRGRTAPPRGRVRPEHGTDEPGAGGAASDPAAGAPPGASPTAGSTRRSSWSRRRAARSRTTTTSSGGWRRRAPPTSTVHQETKVREALHAIATRVPWTAVADRQVDRDLSIGELRIMTARDGERDVAGFARSTVPFRRPLRDVVQQYNAFISKEDLDDLLDQLSDLLDSGILNLRPDASGKTNFNRIKGLLGTLIAARWFRKSGDEATRLLVSLDGEEARRWLHLSDDSLRADLVGFTWTNDHCTVSVIEVKAVQARGIEYAVEAGVVTGPAVDQMLSTRRLLELVFSDNRDDELITTPARREILREHLYRELTKGTYSPAERKLWADRLQRLLDGSVTTDLRCHLIDVRLGVDSESLTNRTVVAHEGENAIPVEITELNERQIEVLIPSEPPEPEAEEGGQIGGPEPPAGGQPPGTPQEPGEPPPAPSDAAAEASEPERGTAAPERAAEPTTTGPDRPRALLGTKIQFQFR